MTPDEIFTVLTENPVFHLATLEDGQPRVRAVFLYKADADGIIFHTGKMKDLYQQLSANPQAELCFNDTEKNLQVRVSGQFTEIDDVALKDEICAHPSRAFLKPWRESGPLHNFYETFRVFKMTNGTATPWTMETNFAPKVKVAL